MRVDASCPSCGALTKQDAVTGRLNYHGWLNGCETTAVEGYDPLSVFGPKRKALSQSTPRVSPPPPTPRERARARNEQAGAAQRAVIAHEAETGCAPGGRRCGRSDCAWKQV